MDQNPGLSDALEKIKEGYGRTFFSAVSESIVLEAASVQGW